MKTELNAFPPDASVEYFQIHFKVFNNIFKLAEITLNTCNTIFDFLVFLFSTSLGPLWLHPVPYEGLEVLSRCYEDLSSPIK